MAILGATPKSWALNSYTAATWADLVAGTAGGESVKGIVICNPTASAASVTIRVATSGGVSLATILPTTSIPAGGSQSLNIDTLNLTASQKLQIYGSDIGLEFYASGISYA